MVRVDLGVVGPPEIRVRCGRRRRLSGLLPWGPVQARFETIAVSSAVLGWVQQYGLELALRLPGSRSIAAGRNRPRVARWTFCGQT